MQGRGNITGCEGASLKAGLKDEKMPETGGKAAGGQRSKKLGREGVTGIDRVCNLGAGKGERGGARNLWVLTLVPCVEGGRRESEGGRVGRAGQTVI